MIAGFASLVFFSFKQSGPGPAIEDQAVSTVNPFQDGAEDQMGPGSQGDRIRMSSSHPLPAAQTQPNSGTPITIDASPRDLQQLKIVNEILGSKNDNDPRMDTELKQLSPAGKAMLRARYSSLQTESRNERGTLVFLVGRELSTADDLAFIKQVLSESPCYSLSHCDREDAAANGPGERHWEGANEVTLAYPQIVALKQLDAYLSSPQRKQQDSMAAAIREEIALARRSPVAKVASLANEIAARHGL